MRATAKAIKSFAGSFGIPAYQAQSVPDDVTLPYITFPLKEPQWNQKTTFYMIVWYRDTGYEALLTKTDQILAAVDEGRIIPLEGEKGYLVLYPESPFAQEYNDPEHGAKGMYINLAMNAYHMPGV